MSNNKDKLVGFSHPAMQLKEEEAKKRKYAQFWEYLTSKNQEISEHATETEKKKFQDTKKAVDSARKIVDYNISHFNSRIAVEPINKKMDEIMKTLDEDDERYKQLNKKRKN